MVRRFDGATVRRCDGATVRQFDGATVRRFDGAMVRRCDGSTVRRFDGATVRRYKGKGMKGKIDKINIDDYDYDLPEERIAQYPVRARENSKLLLYNKGIISENIFSNIPEYLPHDSLMVFNNTRVIRARILFRKESGANIEVFCLEPQSPADYELSFGSKKPVVWNCIIGNLKKWKTGYLITEFLFKGSYYKLTAEKVCSEGEVWRIRFSWNSGDITFGEVIESAGHIPLPPYVKREDREG